MHNNDFYVDDKGIYLHLYGDLSKLVMSKEVFVEAYKKWIVGEELHWIDNADSYICPDRPSRSVNPAVRRRSAGNEFLPP